MTTRAFAVLALASLGNAQGVVNGPRDHLGRLSSSGAYSSVDFTAAGSTAPVKTGTLAARPAGCIQGQLYFATDAPAGQNLYACTATGTPGTWSAEGGSGGTPAGGGSGACSLASSLGFQLNGTDESTLLNSTLAAFSTAGGGCLAIDAGKTLRADGQIVLMSGGSPTFTQRTVRITGAGQGIGGIAGGMDTGVSRIDLRYHGTGDGVTWKAAYGGGPKLLSLGTGILEIDHLTIFDSGSDCAAYVMATIGELHIHDATFVGTSANPATSCNDAIISGGTSQPSSTLNGTITDWNVGPPRIERNRFLNMARAWVAQSSVNNAWFANNIIVGGMATGVRAAIDLQGYGTGVAANRGNIISDNLIELVGTNYVCGINLHNTENAHIRGNGFWDGTSGSYALCGDSTAIKNDVDRGNFVDVTGSKFTNATWSDNNYMPWRTVPFFFDGGGSALAGTSTRCGLVPFGGLINRFSMVGDQSGSATVTVKAVGLGAYTGPGSATDISNTGETMSNALSRQDAALTGWTYTAGASTLPPNSILCFTLSNPSGITWLAGNVQVWEGR